jgi:hypothetical protein
MQSHLRPHLCKSRFQIGVFTGNIIGGMIIQNQIDLQLLSPAYHLIHKIIKKRIHCIIRTSVGHVKQINRKSDNVTSQTFDINKILLCVFRKLNVVSRRCLEPSSKVYTFGKWCLSLYNRD